MQLKRLRKTSSYVLGSIEVPATVDIEEVLSELNKDEIAEYFYIGEYDDSTHLGLIKHLKHVLGQDRPMMPNDRKELICEWIDYTIFNCI